MPSAAAAGPRRVLILSASMGAGHDGAAHELARRLAEAGHTAAVKDFLDSGPLHIGPALRSGYELELKHLPSAYDATYRFWYRVPWLAQPLAWLICLLAGRRVLHWVRATGAEVVVSTYPLSTLCLGRLRSRGHLGVPAVNFITDFGVHPLWVHRGIDLNLAVHHQAAAAAAARTGRPSKACGPLVAKRFAPQPGAAQRRAALRSELGLEPGDRAVLVVAGSWGVGDLVDTVDAVGAGGRFVPVVVCGRDTSVRERIERHTARGELRAIVFGWTDRMPDLMAACDALVENAGGLTSLEALRCGLPVVSYHPIAGHGRENTTAMANAGISRLAADAGELAGALAAVTTEGPARQAQIDAGSAMFVGDGAEEVVAAARLGVRPPSRHASRRAPAVRPQPGAAQ